MPGASRQHFLWASLLFFWFLFHVCYLAGHQWSWNSNYLHVLVPRRIRNSSPSSKGVVYKPELQTAVFASVWKCGRKVCSVVRSTGYSCQRPRFSSQFCRGSFQRALGGSACSWPAPGVAYTRCPDETYRQKNVYAAGNKMLIGYCLHKLEGTPKQKRGQLVALPSPSWSP